MPIMPKAYWAYYVKPIGPNVPIMPKPIGPIMPNVPIMPIAH